VAGKAMCSQAFARMRSSLSAIALKDYCVMEALVLGQMRAGMVAGKIQEAGL